MKSSMRWVGFYLLHLSTATVGVMLATAILLESVLKPFLGPQISHAKLISIATGPYWPLAIVLAGLAGYFGYTEFKGNYSFWVWILPTAYLAAKIILWTPDTVLEDHNWSAALAHFFVGAPPHNLEGNVTLSFYLSLSYTFGALLEAGNVFRFQHSTDGGDC